jgi:predicted acyl esterase
MKKYQPLKEGEIAQSQVSLTPVGMRFAAGENLRVRISGVDRSVFLQ